MPFPKNSPKSLFSRTLSKLSLALLSMFCLWAINKRRLHPLCLKSKAARYVFPIPVAAMTVALLICWSRSWARLSRASFWASFGTISSGCSPQALAGSKTLPFSTLTESCHRRRYASRKPSEISTDSSFQNRLNSSIADSKGLLFSNGRLISPDE